MKNKSTHSPPPKKVNYEENAFSFKGFDLIRKPRNQTKPFPALCKLCLREKYACAVQESRHCFRCHLTFLLQRDWYVHSKLIIWGSVFWFFLGSVFEFQDGYLKMRVFSAICLLWEKVRLMQDLLWLAVLSCHGLCVRSPAFPWLIHRADLIVHFPDKYFPFVRQSWECTWTKRYS